MQGKMQFRTRVERLPEIRLAQKVSIKTTMKNSRRASDLDQMAPVNDKTDSAGAVYRAIPASRLSSKKLCLLLNIEASEYFCMLTATTPLRKSVYNTQTAINFPVMLT